MVTATTPPIRLQTHRATRHKFGIPGPRCRLPRLDEHQSEFPDLDLVAVGKDRRVDLHPIEVGALRLPTSATTNPSPSCRNSACQRLTVTSSRKMSLSGWRPTELTTWSSRNRAPAFDPRRTTIRPDLSGSPSTPVGPGAKPGDCSSPRKSARNIDVLSAASPPSDERFTSTADPFGVGRHRIHQPTPGLSQRCRPVRSGQRSDYTNMYSRTPRVASGLPTTNGR